MEAVAFHPLFLPLEIKLQASYIETKYYYRYVL